MNLNDASIMMIDCQTTGMRPSVGSLLEIAWCRFHPSEEPVVHSQVVTLPDGAEIPRRVQEITGIGPRDLEGSISCEEVLAELRAELARAACSVVVIHYAQFERPFLEDLFAGDLPFQVVCSHQLTKKLFPHLPSSNIRGVSGFFGNRVGEVKRAGAHVQATVQIWRGLIAELNRLDVHDFDSLAAWLSAKPKAKAKKYEYRIDREKRLNLPTRPGVYRMKARSGEVLYVGKATSLRDRVNSYFRGKKGRDTRKLEMLAQVWDLEVTECKSALEAALLETDEIKRYNPPYNVTLKTGRRKLVYYTRDFERVGAEQGPEYPIGAFKTFNAIEDLRQVLLSLRAGVFVQVFHDVLPPEDIELGFSLFCSTEGVGRGYLNNMRLMLALALRLYRRDRKQHRQTTTDGDLESPEVADLSDVSQVTGDADVSAQPVLTIEEVSAKFGRLFFRAGRELWRARQLTRLLNAHVAWESADGRRTVEVRDGKIVESPAKAAFRDWPWRGLDISDYDRMSVLLSGIAHVVHSVFISRTSALT